MVFGIVKFTETASRTVVAQEWREEGNENLFNGYRVSLLQNKKVLETGCTTMWVYLTPLNYTIRNVSVANFVLKKMPLGAYTEKPGLESW